MTLTVTRSDSDTESVGRVLTSTFERWTIGAGLNDGLFQKRWTFVTLPSILSAVSVCVSRRIYAWHMVYLSSMDPCPNISS